MITKERMEMEGLYLYCIREKTENTPAISTKGIDGKGEIYALPFRKLEAIVSKVLFRRICIRRDSKKGTRRFKLD